MAPARGAGATPPRTSRTRGRGGAGGAAVAVGRALQGPGAEADQPPNIALVGKAAVPVRGRDRGDRMVEPGRASTQRGFIPPSDSCPCPSTEGRRPASPQGRRTTATPVSTTQAVDRPLQFSDARPD